ncbi:hypothetical protein OH773_22305 (plasmid) [Buttiauxella sp. WJP83]|uniref:hypothetical protein n=1 Tax=Buttiauxella sp. WJP83 TaxID=2986951 RepID=UPI0022DE1BB2|nr:hypothetical protein [Buttiauxella sp. WJP83]WBM72977.1 hypothetical protein OH773_22305 [Buttiauxella sp. WJP83]
MGKPLQARTRRANVLMIRERVQLLPELPTRPDKQRGSRRQISPDDDAHDTTK